MLWLLLSVPLYAADTDTDTDTVTAVVVSDTDTDTDTDSPPPKAAAEDLKVEVPATVEEATEDVQSAIDAVAAGKWATAIALLLGVLFFAYRRFKAKPE